MAYDIVSDATFAGTVTLAGAPATDLEAATKLYVDSASHPVADYSETIGDGVATSIAVTHSLGSTDVVVVLKNVSTGAVVGVDAVVTDANTVTFDFAVAPTSSQYRATIIAG